MNITFLKTSVLWGIALWLFGYILGIVLFPIVPSNYLGWVIMPLGIISTLWVLFKKISPHSLADYLLLSVVWTALAIILDYFLLVRVFKPADGYYKLDVYLYYLLTFLIPLIIGAFKRYNRL